LYDFTGARDFYREATSAAGIGMHRSLLAQYIEFQALLIAPLAPHWADYIWQEVLHKVSQVSMPNCSSHLHIATSLPPSKTPSGPPYRCHLVLSPPTATTSVRPPPLSRQQKQRSSRGKTKAKPSPTIPNFPRNSPSLPQPTTRHGRRSISS
jgi:isoleucyl-tRNA synthetase